MFRLTDAGSAILAKAIAGAELTFTRGAFGDGLAEGNYESVSALVSERMSLPIVGIENVDNTVRVAVKVTNNKLAEGFQVREAGLFAQDGDKEILYGYVDFGEEGDYMPALESGIAKNYNFVFNVVISADIDVRAVIKHFSVEEYTLPAATREELGGIMVGNRLSIDAAGKLDVIEYNEASSSAAGLMSAADKEKLDGLSSLEASASSAGLMSAADKNKLDGLESLQAASETQLGGIMIGFGLSIDAAGKLSVTVKQYELPPATSEQLGGVMVGNRLTVDSAGKLNFVDYAEATGSAAGLMSAADKAKLNGLESLQAASANKLGGIKPGNGLVMDGDVLNVKVEAEKYNDATTSQSGLMSASDKQKLNGLSNYTLPTASSSTKGGIKPGTGLSMSGETLNCTVTGSSYTLPAATSSTRGGIRPGTNLSMSGDVLNCTYSYQLPTASGSTKGGVRVGSGLAMSGETLYVTLQASGLPLSTSSSTTNGWMWIG